QLLEERVHESETLKTRLSLDSQEAEKSMLNTDHRVSSLAADVDRARQRLRLATSEMIRLTDERAEIERALMDAELSLTDVGSQKIAIEEEIQLRTRRSEELRVVSDDLQRDLAGLQSQLAVLQERRSTVARELTVLGEQAADLERRAKEAEMQIQQAGEQQEQTCETIESLDAARGDLVRRRELLDAAIAEKTVSLEELRRELHEAEAKWDETRALLDSWKDRHTALEIQKT